MLPTNIEIIHTWLLLWWRQRDANISLSLQDYFQWYLLSPAMNVSLYRKEMQLKFVKLGQNLSIPTSINCRNLR